MGCLLGKGVGKGDGELWTDSSVEEGEKIC
jgi:hypothetical protein